jgi:replicative DNA helicase
MLSDFTLNEMISVLCKIPNDHQSTPDIVRSISGVLDWGNENLPKDRVTYQMKIKLDLAKYLCDKRLGDTRFSLQDSLESLRGGKFDDMVPVLEEELSRDTEGDYTLYQTKILNRFKLCQLLTTKKDIKVFIDSIDNECFLDDNELITKWESLLSDAYSDLMNIKKIESIQNTSSLNLSTDSYLSVMLDLEETVDNRDIVKTGFKYLEEKLPTGGLERKRFYLVGGSSGVGKSLFLNQLLVNAVKNSTYKNEDNKEDVFLYITAENLIGESLVRFYCSLTGEQNRSVLQKLRKNKFLRKYKNGSIDEQILRDMDINPESEMFDFSDSIKAFLSNTSTDVMFRYVPARRTTIRDIESLIDSVAVQKNLRGVFIDYLDLIVSRFDFPDERIMLGEVAQAFKNFAVTYNVPVVSATQLNREGYNTKVAPSLVQMSESMKKIDPADSVMFLQNCDDGQCMINGGAGTTLLSKKIRITLLKNRNGPTGDTGFLAIPEKTADDFGRDVFNFTILDLPKMNDDTTAASSYDFVDAYYNYV